MMKKSESLVTTLAAVYAYILLICIFLYWLFKYLQLDIGLSTNLLIWSATIFAPVAVLITYTNWREQKGAEVISNYCKVLVIQLVELEHLSNQICNGLMFGQEESERLKKLNAKFIFIFNEQVDSFRFLNEAISEKQLKSQISQFQTQCLRNYVRYRALIDSSDKKHIANITPRLGKIHCEQNSKLREELMNYVLYKKE